MSDDVTFWNTLKNTAPKNTFFIEHLWATASDQGKVAHETTTFGWVCPGVLNHNQTQLDLPRVPLVGLGEQLDQKKFRMKDQLITQETGGRQTADELFESV